jgi:hypothetical protein
MRQPTSGKAHFRGGLPRGRDYAQARAPQPDLGISKPDFFADGRIQNRFAIAAPIATKRRALRRSSLQNRRFQLAVKL